MAKRLSMIPGYDPMYASIHWHEALHVANVFAGFAENQKVAMFASHDFIRVIRCHVIFPFT